MTAEYLLTSLVVILLPGTGVLYTLASGLGRGWHASVLAAFGCTLGILPHIAASIAGLAAVLHASALTFQIVKYLGAAYLIYMAWSVLRAGGALQLGERPTPVSPVKIIGDGFVLNILNPKLSLFFLAFLPQFVKPENGSVLLQLTTLGIIFVALGLTSTVFFALFAGSVGGFLQKNQTVVKWQGRAVGSIYCALGVRLAFQER